MGSLFTAIARAGDGVLGKDLLVRLWGLYLCVVKGSIR